MAIANAVVADLPSLLAFCIATFWALVIVAEVVALLLACLGVAALRVFVAQLDAQRRGTPVHARSGVRHRGGLWLRLDFCDHAASHHEAQTGEEGKDDIHGREERWDEVHTGPVLRRI